MKKYVVFDIHGTIADVSHRLHFIEGPVKNWDEFHAAGKDDLPIESMIRLLAMIMERYPVVFCTTGPEKTRAEAVKWLKSKVGFYTNENVESIPLLMRKDKDYRHDEEIKPELLKNSGLTPENVLFIVEDRARVVEKLRKIGFKVLQCGPGLY
jgi:FMN phosphatase YigB (HAD superfamily)